MMVLGRVEVMDDVCCWPCIDEVKGGDTVGGGTLERGVVVLEKEFLCSGGDSSTVPSQVDVMDDVC